MEWGMTMSKWSIRSYTIETESGKDLTMYPINEIIRKLNLIKEDGFLCNINADAVIGDIMEKY